MFWLPIHIPKLFFALWLEELYLTTPGVDYVPSFELVTNPKQVANHYLANWRTVSDAGVLTAMNCFLGQHQDACASSINVQEEFIIRSQ